MDNVHCMKSSIVRRKIELFIRWLFSTNLIIDELPVFYLTENSGEWNIYWLERILLSFRGITIICIYMGKTGYIHSREISYDVYKIEMCMIIYFDITIQCYIFVLYIYAYT